LLEGGPFQPKNLKSTNHSLASNKMVLDRQLSNSAFPHLRADAMHRKAFSRDYRDHRPASALPSMSCFAWAQAYPTRPVRLIVGAPAVGDVAAVAMSIDLHDALPSVPRLTDTMNSRRFIR
jgi:hypothetical protein